MSELSQPATSVVSEESNYRELCARVYFCWTFSGLKRQIHLRVLLFKVRSSTRLWRKKENFDLNWSVPNKNPKSTLFVSRLQSQGCVWTPDCFFQRAHRTESWRTARRYALNSTKSVLIGIVDCTFKADAVFLQSESWIKVFLCCVWVTAQPLLFLLFNSSPLCVPSFLHMNRSHTAFGMSVNFSLTWTSSPQFVH